MMKRERIQVIAWSVGLVMLTVVFSVLVYAWVTADARQSLERERTLADQQRLLTEIACILALDPEDRDNEAIVRECTNP